MQIVPISQYPSLRRPLEDKSSKSWARDARQGRIPGAFKLPNGGGWFVDLDIHDEEVRNLAAGHKNHKPLDGDLESLAARFGLDEEDMQAAMEAAGA